jgi:hypothetical protein
MMKYSNDSYISLFHLSSKEDHSYKDELILIYSFSSTLRKF